MSFPKISTTPYSCTILADSLHPRSHRGVQPRLTTVAVVLPRPFTAEMNTHRMFSRNSASSRAIPTSVMIESVRSRTYVPDAFLRLRPGMSGGAPLDEEAQEQGRRVWLAAAEAACGKAEELRRLGAHKEHVNRLLEPFLFTTIIITASTWSNFFSRRLDPGAQPEMRVIALAIKEAMSRSEPRIHTDRRQWCHLPLVSEEERADRDLLPLLPKLSAARCARVSYLTHDGIRDPTKDVELYHRLLSGGHMSPLEHPARLGSPSRWYGNFLGFEQYRKVIPGEADLPPSWES